MLKFRYVILVVLFLAISFALIAASPKNVFGTDERIELNANLPPFNTIGKLSTYCTATLVGPRHVVTASHCVGWKDDGTYGELIFNLGYKNGKSVDSSKVVKVYSKEKFKDLHQLNSDDWAILILEKRLGDKVGWMDLKKFRPEEYKNFIGTKETFTNVGYSNNYQKGEVGSVALKCNLKNVKEGFLLHDCDNGKGASGGPIFKYIESKQKGIISAIHVAEANSSDGQSGNFPDFSVENANCAVPTTNLADELEKALSENP